MLNEQMVRQLLDQVAEGVKSPGQAFDTLRWAPFEDIGFAKVDHHRQLRHHSAEVVYCEGKTPSQVAQIVARLAKRCGRLLATRATREQYTAATAIVPELQYDQQASILWMDREPDPSPLRGVVLAAAGTSDIRVAEEAALTLQLMGHAPERIYDVGVAGLHRLLYQRKTLEGANVIIVLAGMEGALPSVVGGLIDAPVIAVPTSIGYGASFGGLAALLAMLNSCSPGVAVVNIDNGYGAGILAAKINRRIVCPDRLTGTTDPETG